MERNWGEKLVNKVAIVTGGIHGIGFAAVQFLLKEGAEYVGIFDSAESDCSTVVDGLKKLETNFKKDNFGYYVTDARNEKEFAANYDKVMEQKNHVDILINNANLAGEKDKNVLIDVNLKAVMQCTTAGIERMKKQKENKDCVIVILASFLKLFTFPPFFDMYNATKSALDSFVRSLKHYNKTFGLNIFRVYPPFTDAFAPLYTNRNRGWLPDDEDAEDFKNPMDVEMMLHRTLVYNFLFTFPSFIVIEWNKREYFSQTL